MKDEEQIKKSFTFIDLFAGIGGFHIAMHGTGGKCVFASEIDKYARQTYEHNFRNISPEIFETGNFNQDINDVDIDKIPDFDVLCAGFPCQPFSNAGLRRGFEDTRGTLFFSIAEIINAKINKGAAPKVILLENVKGLKSHNKGKTLETIKGVLYSLGYEVKDEVLNSKNFGVPQNRQRIFIVGRLRNDKNSLKFYFPYGLDINNNPIFDKSLATENAKPTVLGSILYSEVAEKYTISNRSYEGHKYRAIRRKEIGINRHSFSVFSRNSPYANTITARYYKDGKEILIEQEGKNPRRLSPKEAGRLQGYPIDNGFEIIVSDSQAWKQFGNSVSVPVVKALAKEIKRQLLYECDK